MSAERVTPAAVAFPERSLAYAPLLVVLGLPIDSRTALGAARSRVGTAERLIPLLCDGGAQVAEAVASGAALAGALPLPGLVAAVAAGAPLVAFSALTRRWGGQLVVAREAELPRHAEGLRDGSWRNVRVGLQTGSDGSERLVRLWLLAAGLGHVSHSAQGAYGAQGILGFLPAPPGDGSPPAHLGRDPWEGEPRWLGFSTGEALVAALKDGRIVAFVGPSSAAAQAVILGVGEVVANFSDGSTAPDVSAALPAVLVARQERIGDPALSDLRVACARAGATLSGAEGPALVTRAFRERDPLALRLALRLDVPQPSGGETDAPRTAAREAGAPAAGALAADAQREVPPLLGGLYAADGQLPVAAVERYLQLAAAAGATPSVAAAALVAPLGAAP